MIDLKQGFSITLTSIVISYEQFCEGSSFRRFRIYVPSGIDTFDNEIFIEFIEKRISLISPPAIGVA